MVSPPAFVLPNLPTAATAAATSALLFFFATATGISVESVHEFHLLSVLNLINR
jgi:hypothetical protein